MTEKIPVSVAAQVVAAGIFGDRARFTLVLIPIYDKESGQYDLAEWPAEIENKLLRFHSGFEIISLGEHQSWRTKEIFEGSTTKITYEERLRRIGSPDNLDKLMLYWRDVMGGEEGLKALGAALDPKTRSELKDPLDAAWRPKEGSHGQTITPDVHGTGRDKIAKELTLERAAHTAARLKKRLVRTRPEAEASGSVSARLEEWTKNRVGPWPRSQPPLKIEQIVKLAEEVEDWNKLEQSRGRADNLAAARAEYQNATSSKEAVCALVKAHEQLLSRTPLDVAAHFSDNNPSTDVPDPDPKKEAIAAYRLASTTPDFHGGPAEPPKDDETVAFARRRLFTLQANPSLGRLFRFVVDFECPVDVLREKNGCCTQL